MCVDLKEWERERVCVCVCVCVNSRVCVCVYVCVRERYEDWETERERKNNMCVVMWSQLVHKCVSSLRLDHAPRMCCCMRLPTEDSFSFSFSLFASDFFFLFLWQTGWSFWDRECHCFRNTCLHFWNIFDRVLVFIYFSFIFTMCVMYSEGGKHITF